MYRYLQDSVCQDDSLSSTEWQSIRHCHLVRMDETDSTSTRTEHAKEKVMLGMPEASDYSNLNAMEVRSFFNVRRNMPRCPEGDNKSMHSLERFQGSVQPAPISEQQCCNSERVSPDLLHQLTQQDRWLLWDRWV